MKLPYMAKNLPNFKGRPWSNALLSLGKGDAGASSDYCLSECVNVGLYHMHELQK